MDFEKRDNLQTQEKWGKVINEVIGHTKNAIYSLKQLQEGEIPDLFLAESLKGELTIPQGKLREVYNFLKKIKKK